MIRSDLNQNIDLLASAYDGATSAYQKWIHLNLLLVKKATCMMPYVMHCST